MDTTGAPITSQLSPKPASNSTLRQRVADSLRAKILNGSLTSGEQLRQQHLALELGVSNNPVREALQILEQEGFVSTHAYRGAVVREVPPDEVFQLAHAMAALEVRALQLAFASINEETIARAKSLADAQRRAKDLNTALDVNLEFHLTLYAASGNAVLFDMIRKCHNQSRRHAFAAQSTFGPGLPPGCPTHRDLLDACTRRTVNHATDILDRHIMQPAEALRRFLDAAPSGIQHR